jgi:hypothetical protein
MKNEEFAAAQQNGQTGNAGSTKGQNVRRAVANSSFFILHSSFKSYEQRICILRD